MIVCRRCADCFLELKLQRNDCEETALEISAALAVILLVVCLLFPNGIVSIFTTDKSIIAACSTYLIFMCINLFAKFINIIFLQKKYSNMTNIKETFMIRKIIGGIKRAATHLS